MAGGCTKSLKETCSEKNLPQCAADQAIKCDYDPGIAGYLVSPEPVSCADGATCAIRTDYYGNEQFDQAFCLVSPETDCSPSDPTLPRCVSDTVVESCAEGPQKLVRYKCPTAAGGPLPKGCGPGGSCTAPNFAPPVDAAPPEDAAPTPDAG